jgi:hypothetical protein
MSYVYIKTESQLWTTGHYGPDGTFHTDEDFDDSEDAADRVAWLNGSPESFEQRLKSIEKTIDRMLGILSNIKIEEEK